ncbi:MAG: hypothetical protein EOM70_11590 [Clostridia bacterium]|nr:hypothetical protein [Clostridia bacterium]
MKGRLKDLTIGLDGTQNITVSVLGDFREDFKKLKEVEVDVLIKKFRRKRSLDSNALCWAVCQELADAMETPTPKEEIYRTAIRDVGEYVPLPIRADAVEAFCTNWAVKGIGWFADIVDDSKIPGYKLVFAYYGSSTYDTKQMSKLLDYLVDEANQMGITLKASKEIQQKARELNVKPD